MLMYALRTNTQKRTDHTLRDASVRAGRCRKPLPLDAYIHAYNSGGINPRPCCSESTKNIVISCNYFHVMFDLQQLHILFTVRLYEIYALVYCYFHSLT